MYRTHATLKAAWQCRKEDTDLVEAHAVARFLKWSLVHRTGSVGMGPTRLVRERWRRMEGWLGLADLGAGGNVLVRSEEDDAPLGIFGGQDHPL